MRHFPTRPFALGVAWLTLVLAGCTRGPTNEPVDAGKARAALRTALDSWKKGEKVDALQAATPPIYIIDPDWQAGAVLKDYRLVGDGDEKDAQLFCPVRITVVGPNGKPTDRDVIFMVSTAPNVTVSRKIF